MGKVGGSKLYIKDSMTAEHATRWTLILEMLAIIHGQMQTLLYPSLFPIGRRSWKTRICEPRHDKTGVREFRQGLTQSGLCSQGRWIKLKISDSIRTGIVLSL